MVSMHRVYGLCCEGLVDVSLVCMPGIVPSPSREGNAKAFYESLWHLFSGATVRHTCQPGPSPQPGDHHDQL